MTVWADEALLPQPWNCCLCLAQPCPRSPGIAACSRAALSLQPPGGSLSLTEPYRGILFPHEAQSLSPATRPRVRADSGLSTRPSLGGPAVSFAATQLSACQAGTSTLSLCQPSLSAALSSSQTDSAPSRQRWILLLSLPELASRGFRGTASFLTQCFSAAQGLGSTSPLRPSPAVVGVLPVHPSVLCLKFYTESLSLQDSSVSLGAGTSFLVPDSAFSSGALS